MNLKEVIEKINSEVNILDVVSDYVELQKVGKNYRALCPFHIERTPSFYIDVEKNLFYCFGCKVGGNIFSFIQKKENISFKEAVNIVAARFLNIEIDSILSGDTSSKFRIIKEILCEALKLFKSELWGKEGEAALKYLQNTRKIKQDTILKFELGYAPEDSNKLLSHLLNLGYTQEDIKDSGLINYSEEENRVYPLFRKRIIFPIFDNLCRVIGFGARAIDDSLPKYINSPVTPLYKKGTTLYGIQLIKTKKEEILLVEGYIDLILCHQEGWENTVATLGTAITKSQANLLKRLTDKVIILFDSDSAGKRATERGIDLLYSTGLKVEILQLENKDPAAILQEEKGKLEFSRIFKKNRKSWFDFLISYFKEKNYSKEIMIDEISPFLDKLPPIEAHELICKLEENLNLPNFVLYAAIHHKKKLKATLKKDELELPFDVDINPNLFSERLILKLILQDEDIKEHILPKLEEEDFVHKPFLNLFIHLKNNGSVSLCDETIEEDLKGVIAELLIGEDRLDDKKNRLNLAEACLKKLKLLKLEREKKLLLEEMKTTQKISEIKELQKKYLSLEEKIKYLQKINYN